MRGCAEGRPPEHAHRLCGGRARCRRGDAEDGVKPGPLPPRAPMYAFYSLLIYIFYSLFRRDGGAAAAADAEANPGERGSAQLRRLPTFPENSSQSPRALTREGPCRIPSLVLEAEERSQRPSSVPGVRDPTGCLASPQGLFPTASLERPL